MKLAISTFVVLLGFAAMAHAQTYTNDTTITDFTQSRAIAYATFSNFSCTTVADPSCATAPFTPTSPELAAHGYRVYGGTFTAAGLPSNDWILASFNTPVSSIVVFPNIDHYGGAFDGYQYQIYGSDDLTHWTPLYNPQTVISCSGEGCVVGGTGEPFTLGTFTGTAPTTVNNVLTLESPGLPASCSAGVLGAPCAIGYIATFNFPAAYQYYVFGASSEASSAENENTDQELSAVGAFIPESGAMLEIKGTVTAGDPVNEQIDLIVYDSQIHTGVVQTPVASPSTFPTNCVAGDQIPTDAYVLQAEAPTGCDPGDANEANLTNPGKFKFVSPAGSPAPYEFDITTQYSEDSGSLTVLNNSASTFSGTITLSGTPQGTVCGTSPLQDQASSGLGAGAQVVLALTYGEGASDTSDCGGFEAPQTQPLTAGTTTTFQFGNDAYKITPINSTVGDTITFLPVPTPAGPLGLNSWGAGNFGLQHAENPVASSPLRFSAPDFPGQACIPFSSLSALKNPVCPEVQLDCTPAPESVNDCGDFLYTAELDFSIDKNSFPSGVGGVEFLGVHSDDCPTADFNFNIFFSYTATNPDPTKGQGSGQSCFATTFDATAQAVAVGQTVKQETLNGFFLPVIDNPPNRLFFNRVEAGGTVPLIWQTENSADKPVTNLGLCANSTGTGCTAPWVNVASAPVSCITGVFTGPITTDMSLFNSGLIKLGGGFYVFFWQTPRSATGCATPVLTFSTGFTSFGLADFRFVPED